MLSLRQGDPEATAGSCRFKREVAAIHFDRPFRNREPQTGSAALAGASLIDAIETIKDSRSQLYWNAGTGVDHIDCYTGSGLCDTHIDAAASRRIFDCVVQQIKHGLPQNQTVAGPA